MGLHQLTAGNESTRRTGHDATLHGRWLILARGMFVALFGFSLTVFFADLAEYFAQLHSACGGSDCALWQLTPTSIQALQQAGLTVESYAIFSVALSVISVLVWCTAGAIIAWRKSNDWMALLVATLLVTTGVAGQSLPDLNLQTTGLVASASPWFVPTLVVIFLATFLFLLVFLLFPDGRFVPHWTRWLLVAGIALLGGTAIVFISPAPFSQWLYLLFVVGIVGTEAPALFAQLYRYRYVSTPMQRQQTKWIVMGVMVGLLVAVGGAIPPLLFPSLNHPGLYVLIVKPVATLILLFAPLCFGIAILRYRLWDIDIIIHRALVYAALSACVIGIYVLVVAGLGSLLQAQGNILLSLLATGLIAISFQPLRQRLQQAVNRLLYGERDDPYRVLTRLGQRLEATLTPDAVLPMIVETIAHALKLPFVAITWTPQDASAETTILAAYGKADEQAARESVPLIYQNEVVGELVLEPRQRGEVLTPADQRFLRELAPQIGVAVHAIRLGADLKQLTVDLQHSREQLVTAREDERRRLRRDLHDGLGPQLSSQTLTLAAARKLLRQDPDAANRLLIDATTHAQEAIADIRRLVYALRPPALDDLGLLAALQEQLTQYRASGISLTLDAPEKLPPLPAAVEVACYRIAQEALTNVVCHAHAHTCTIHLTVDEHLVLEIRDDGQGLPPAYRRGIGLTSMRERAEELGGTCTISAQAEGGTCVLAHLPLGDRSKHAGENGVVL